MRPRKFQRRPGRIDSIGLLKNAAELGIFRDPEFVTVAEAVMAHVMPRLQPCMRITVRSAPKPSVRFHMVASSP